MNVNNVNNYNNISTGMVLQNNQHHNMMGNIAQNQLSTDVSPEYLQFLERCQIGANIEQNMLQAMQGQNNQNTNNNMQNYVNAVNSENANNSMNNVNNDNYRYFVANNTQTGGGGASFFKVDITDQECKVKEADDKLGEQLLMDMQEYADNHTNDHVLPMATLMNDRTQLLSGENVEPKKFMFLKNGLKMGPQEILNEVMINQQKLNEALKEVEQGL